MMIQEQNMIYKEDNRFSLKQFSNLLDKQSRLRIYINNWEKLVCNSANFLTLLI